MTFSVGKIQQEIILSTSISTSECTCILTQVLNIYPSWLLIVLVFERMVYIISSLNKKAMRTRIFADWKCYIRNRKSFTVMKIILIRMDLGGGGFNSLNFLFWNYFFQCWYSVVLLNKGLNMAKVGSFLCSDSCMKVSTV